jgi:cytochrome c2
MRRLILLAVVVAWCSPAFAQDAAKVDRGKALFSDLKCKMCHSVEGQGNPKGVLDGVGAKFRADDLHKWLMDPKGMAEKAKATRQPPMKPVTASADDLDALVAYLSTLKTEKK